MLPDADVYLLDEPMMGLDGEAIERLMGRLKQMSLEGKTVLIGVAERVGQFDRK
jgi:ABC-type multidrug transport system ATPase subunit